MNPSPSFRQPKVTYVITESRSDVFVSANLIINSFTSELIGQLAFWLGFHARGTVKFMPQGRMLYALSAEIVCVDWLSESAKY